MFGFRSKLTYFIRTIPNTENILVPLEEAIRYNLIPALTGGHQCSDLERKLLALPARYGGLGLTVYTNISNHGYENSRKITKELTNSIFQQDIEYNVNVDNIKKIKNQLKHEKNERFQMQP